jgi:Xaa-Pro aminopeptidase
LNLRGSDIPYNPLFHAYLFVGLESAVLFVEISKVQDDVASYLKDANVQLRSYTDLWPFLRRREWGEGKVSVYTGKKPHLANPQIFISSFFKKKVLIAPQTSYAISLMLTHFRYTLAPSYIEHMMSIKNETEIDGMRRAYLRDGVSFVRVVIPYPILVVNFDYLLLGEIPGLAREQAISRL